MDKPEITYTIEVEQDDVQVRGNAIASGDDAYDKQVENEILDRLDRGDVWAWACVTVIAKCGNYQGKSSLCGCSYKNEKDFVEDSGSYEDMKAEAKAFLLQNMEEAVSLGTEAADLLSRLS